MKENTTKLENQIEELKLEYEELKNKIKIIENKIYRKKTILHIKYLLNDGWFKKNYSVAITERSQPAWMKLISFKQAKIEIKFLIKKGGNINEIIDGATTLDIAIKEAYRVEKVLMECEYEYEKEQRKKQLKHVQKWITILRKLGALTKEELDNLKSK
jgi:hypothetical protein